MHFPFISFLTELWHLLDVSAVVEHGAEGWLIEAKMVIDYRPGRFNK